MNESANNTARDRVIRAEVNITHLDGRLTNFEKKLDKAIEEQEKTIRLLQILTNDLKWAHRIVAVLATALGASVIPLWDFFRHALPWGNHSKP